jgi:hypothetical protein
MISVENLHNAKEECEWQRTVAITAAVVFGTFVVCILLIACCFIGVSKYRETC